ncbi:6-phosphogluconate dehydrogenase (decarboxylating) [Pontibacter ummariensis]|uniref:6-phosphogluconate dehydrogenase, decarboxylating n=1 Tax=Pontibacter ummariensis TaxID=1610492 RepID=A0A239GPL0_9BACT|nr:NADP-dependent phosphogluconate dehydrogenase [Pontibacter ummariensis]PRY11374.1 6-phosphogluconate dehydrogenase (decarboxylating) [Pontibacter ummariensis]SNS71077.1 6-phosphogluconate dehydrogenase (decarboxylating) [Pontibacter ummariensis]
MNDIQYEFGMVGLGVMGRNLMLNIADHDFSVIGLDLDPEKAAAVEAEAGAGRPVRGTTSTEEFVQSLRTPRAIMLLVPAGKAVDAVIATLVPLLEPGDIVIDGGNSYFPDTDRRVVELAEQGIHFFGMGISGGEKGARFGPSMMPGGNREAYERLRPVFEAVAAKVNGEPCVTYLGSGSAGNYVKMVHNGIEYGIMQLIAETYDLLRRGAGLSDDELQDIFQGWNETELQSFLIEITGDILQKKDELTGKRLVSVISDRARSKGTGKWTSQNAMDLQVPVPTIDTAVLMRDMSKYKEERVEAAKLLPNEALQSSINADREKLVSQMRNTFYFAMIATYAQGLAQLKVASEEYNYGLQLQEVAKIWRGGCIIRAACLSDIRTAYEQNPSLPNLLLDKKVGGDMMARQEDVRAILKIAIDKGIPMPAFMSALSYFDAYRTETLPTNLIQAQRDYFGAHTYERIDQEGIFHTQWT